jgi:hypothetical protein
VTGKWPLQGFGISILTGSLLFNPSSVILRFFILHFLQRPGTSRVGLMEQPALQYIIRRNRLKEWGVNHPARPHLARRGGFRYI